MRVIRVSKLFKIIIYFLTLYILGFDKIIALPGSTFIYDIIIVLLGVSLALYVNQKCLSNQYLRSQCKFYNYCYSNDLFNDCIWI